MSVEITPEEQAELDRQNQEADNKYFHDVIRCGKPLILKVYYRQKYNSKYKVRKYFCSVHLVYCSLSGWQEGYFGGTESKTKHDYSEYGKRRWEKTSGWYTPQPSWGYFGDPEPSGFWGMSTKAFIRDRKRGREGQDYVALMFGSWGLTVRNMPDGYFPGYDIEAVGKLQGIEVNFKCEVKYDIKAQETGNFYLDIAALRHSKAGMLAIVTDNPRTVYLLPLQDALKYALAHQNTKGGEYQEPACLVSIEDFKTALKPQVLTTKEWDWIIPHDNQERPQGL